MFSVTRVRILPLAFGSELLLKVVGGLGYNQVLVDL